MTPDAELDPIGHFRLAGRDAIVTGQVLAVDGGWTSV